MIADTPRLGARGARRRLFRDAHTRAWMIAWLGGVVVGVVNGSTRELTYGKAVDELAAHQISTATGVALFAAYFAALATRWPLPTARRALEVGVAWVVLTAAFDFVFGHYVDGKPWSTLAHDYDVADGRLWPLVLLWLMTGPAAIHRVRHELHDRKGRRHA